MLKGGALPSSILSPLRKMYRAGAIGAPELCNDLNALPKAGVGNQEPRPPATPDSTGRTRERHKGIGHHFQPVRSIQGRRLDLCARHFSFRTTDLAAVLGKGTDSVTYIQREGIRQRLDDETFQQRYENLDAEMVEKER